MSLESIHSDIHTMASQCGLEVDCISSGDVNSRIAIVSDHPGKAEKLSKVPFSGYSGTFLWRTLGKYIQVKPNNIYVTNIDKSFSERDDEEIDTDYNTLSLWASILEYELECLPNLEYVFVLGAKPLKGLLHKTVLKHWRGSVIEKIERCETDYGIGQRTLKYLISYNPAFVIKKNFKGEYENPLLKPIFEFDVRKFGRLIKGEYQPYNVQCNIVRSIDDFHHVVNEIEKTNEPISIDDEHWNKQTSIIGLALDNKLGYVIPFCDMINSLWSLEDELYIRLGIIKALRNKKLIGQNANTDCYWLMFKDRIPLPPLWFDTLLAHHLLNSSLSHALEFLVSQYTWHPYYKDEGETWKYSNDLKMACEYNAKDTVLTRYIALEELLPELKERKLDKLFFEHVMPTNAVCTQATILGVKVDNEEKERFKISVGKEIDAEREELTDYIKALCPEFEINDKTVNSPKQLCELFYDKLKLFQVGKRSTDEAHLNRWLESSVVDKTCKDMINKLLTYRENAKFKSTYADTEIDDDGRYRTEYMQFSVRTAPGRAASGKNQWGTGGNFQNQPKRARSQYIADDGCCFIYFDGEQAEARVVGWRACIKQWKQEFEQARLNPGTFDCHRALASRIFNVPYEKIPTYDYELDGKVTTRFIGKKARHGLNYRLGPEKFATDTGISIMVANRVYNEYHKEIPELRAWWQWSIDKLKETKKKFGYGKLVNAFGRELIILEDITQASTDMAVAFYPQSTVGDWVKWVWHKCLNDDRWPRDKAFIPLNNHDSLTGIAKHEVAKTCLSLFKEYAETPLMIEDIHGNIEPLIIPVELKMSIPDEKGIHRWSNLKKIVI